jgi:hypothetical protein
VDGWQEAGQGVGAHPRTVPREADRRVDPCRDPGW